MHACQIDVEPDGVALVRPREDQTVAGRAARVEDAAERRMRISQLEERQSAQDDWRVELLPLMATILPSWMTIDCRSVAGLPGSAMR